MKWWQLTWQTTSDQATTHPPRPEGTTSHAYRACQAERFGVTVHPGAAAVEQDRATGPGAGRPVDGPRDRWWQWDQDDPGSLAADAQHPVAVFFAEVGDVSAGGFEDPQAE